MVSFFIYIIKHSCLTSVLLCYIISIINTHQKSYLFSEYSNKREIIGMDIERLFNEEVREKKRIGSNIFSRVSTRKGGGNQALRTPYLYMSRKERKQLNGDVRSFNMNEIMKYDEFKELSLKDQKDLMEHWRNTYQTSQIMRESGMSRGIFYKKLHQLGIETDTSKFNPNKRRLTDDEMDTYLNDEFIDFDLFKETVRDQQIKLLEKYLEIKPSVRELCRNWNGANEGYIYNVKSIMNKVKEYEKNQNEIEDGNIATSKSVAIEANHVKSKPVFKMPKTFRLVKPTEETNLTPEDSDETHASNIEINGNEFNFKLKGQYTADAVIRRIQLALEELRDSEELLDLEIKISIIN